MQANNASVKAVGSSKMLGRTSAEAEQQRIREQQERSSDVKQTLHAGRGLSEQEQGQSRDLQDTIRTHEEKIAHLRSVTDDRQHNDGHIVQAERQETLPFEVKDRDKTVERHQQQQLRHVSRARAMHARNRAEKAAGSGEMFAAEKGLSSKTQLTGRLGQVVGLGLCSIVGIACD